MITSTPITSSTLTVASRVFTATDTGLLGGAAQSTAITTIALCNIGTPTLTDETIEAVTVNIHLVKASSTASARNLIVSNLTVPAGETVFFSDERIILDGSDSVWVGATAGATDNAGTFVVGRLYVIESVGDTDFTLIGAAPAPAPAPGPGTIFTATGVGAGTGTARRILIVSTVSTLPV
jgi:hypothetical protein